MNNNDVTNKLREALGQMLDEGGLALPITVVTKTEILTSRFVRYDEYGKCVVLDPQGAVFIDDIVSINGIGFNERKGL